MLCTLTPHCADVMLYSFHTTAEFCVMVPIHDTHHIMGKDEAKLPVVAWSE